MWLVNRQFSFSGPSLVCAGVCVLSPLCPEGVGTSIESVLELETGAQGGNMAAAGSSSPEETVRGGGG